MKFVYTNGFWPGFDEKTDGVHMGFFEQLLKGVFEEDIVLTKDIQKADILLESHFSPSVFYAKTWSTSIFFSGEGSPQWRTPTSPYSYVLGAQGSGPNHVPCPLFLAYECSTPGTYTTPITRVPSKPLCSVISSDSPSERLRCLEYLVQQGCPIDFGGRYRNNIGKRVSGQYYEPSILAFLQDYRLVCAFENNCLDNYITEKIINPMRASTIPLYLGSKKIASYINPDRIVQIDPANYSGSLEEIRRLLTDDTYWLEKVNRPVFVKPIPELVQEISAAMKRVLNPTESKAYGQLAHSTMNVEIICNVEAEANRLPTLRPFLEHYGIKPSCETYGSSVKTHPYYSKFSSSTLPAISLAINHVVLMEKHRDSQKPLLLFESDVLPLYEFQQIDQHLATIMKSMRDLSIDFVFLGKGCFQVMDTRGLQRATPNLFFSRRSRCTEAYLVSPKGIQAYLNYFYTTENHRAIDGDFNMFFEAHPEIGCALAIPELVCQGSHTGLYKSLVPIH